MTAPLPLCVIGAGSIGARHIEVALASAATTLTAVVEPSPERRESLATQGLPVVAEISQVPDLTRAAIVATPTAAHLPCTMQALDRGWSVLCEKPFAGSVDEGRAMIARAQALDLPLFTGHHRRCHPFSQAARAAVQELGAPVGIQGFWSLRKHDSYYDAQWRRQPGHGPVMSNLSHEIDLLQFFFGSVQEVTALTSNARRGFVIEDTAALALRFDNGALGSFLVSDAGASPWAFEAATDENPAIASSGEDYLRITGTDGSLAFPSLTVWRGGDGATAEWRSPLHRQSPSAYQKVDPLLVQLERVASVIEGRQDDVLCTGEDGLAALEMTLAVALSGQRQTSVARGAVPGDYRGI